MAEPTRTQARAAEIRLRWLTLAAFAAPLLVLVAVFGTRFGLWDAGFGLEVLTLKIGRILAFAGLAAALVAVLIAFKDLRRRGAYARKRVIVDRKSAWNAVRPAPSSPKVVGFEASSAV